MDDETRDAGSDVPAESTESGEKAPDKASDEAVSSLSELVKSRRREMFEQKRGDRAPTAISREFGRVVADKDGSFLVNGTRPGGQPGVTGQDASVGGNAEYDASAASAARDAVEGAMDVIEAARRAGDAVPERARGEAAGPDGEREQASESPDDAVRRIRRERKEAQLGGKAAGFLSMNSGKLYAIGDEEVHSGRDATPPGDAGLDRIDKVEGSGPGNSNSLVDAAGPAQAAESFKQAEYLAAEQTSEPERAGTGLEPSKEYRQEDGSVVLTNDKGQISRVVDAAGAPRDFAYENGKLAEVRKGNEVWTSSDGENWTDARGRKWQARVEVRDDGSFWHHDLRTDELTVANSNGETIVADPRWRHIRVEDSQRRLIETRDALGRCYRFSYGKDGRVNEFTDPAGNLWRSEDGKNWTVQLEEKVPGAQLAGSSSDPREIFDQKQLLPRSIEGELSLAADGSFEFRSSIGSRLKHYPNGIREIEEFDGRTVLELGPGREERIQPAVNVAEMKAAAEKIYQSFSSRSSDTDTIVQILQSKNEAERRHLQKFYPEGRNLEEDIKYYLSGSDADRALNYLKYGAGDVAGHVHTALMETGEWTGRSRQAVEADLRQTMSVLTAHDIQEVDRQYKERYGVGLREALMNNTELSATTRTALHHYLKGADNRDDQTTLALAGAALQSRDIDMLKEAFRNSSASARQRFQDTGGAERLKKAFGTPTYDLDGQLKPIGYRDNVDWKRAREYAKSGELSTATLVRFNRSAAGDNEDAIEEALFNMKAGDRELYLVGRVLATQMPLPELSEEQRKAALDYYKDLKGALDAAGNSTEIARWEDMIAVEGGTIVGKLTRHSGSFNDDEVGVYKELENMSEDDWKRLKNDPKHRAQIEAALKTFMSAAETKLAMAIVDRKKEAGTYEEADKLGRRPLLQAITDEQGVFSIDERAVAQAIVHMTPEEQRQYRDNPDYRDKIDEALKLLMQEGPEREAARRLLDKVRHGQEPTMDIVTRLKLHAGERMEHDALVDGVGLALALPTFGSSVVWTQGDAALGRYGQDFVFGSNARDVIVELQKAFDDDPGLRERIKNNPDSPEAKEFYKALGQAMRPADLEHYARSLIDNGHLSPALQMEFSRGIVDDDEMQAYADVLRLAPEDREKILTDVEFRGKVLGFMSPEEQEVALNNLRELERVKADSDLTEEQRQERLKALYGGDMRPEDAMRAYMLGAGTDVDRITDLLESLSPDERKQMAANFAAKYGSDLKYELSGETSGGDWRKLMSLMKGDQGVMGEFFDALEAHGKSRSGFSAGFVDNFWDGTGIGSDEAINSLARAIEARGLGDLSPEEMQKAIERHERALDLYRESKGAAADALVDAGLILVGLAAAKFTGGASLGLLAKTGLVAGLFAAGAAGKAGFKYAFMDDDYDSAPMDLFTGGLELATIGLAPELIMENIVGVGKEAAARATGGLITASSEGGAALIEKGSKETLERGLRHLIAEGVESGAKELSEEAIVKLAARVARDGSDEGIRAVAGAIKSEVSDAITKESAKYLANALKRRIPDIGAGMLEGAIRGTFEGVYNWDESKGLLENLEVIAASAALNGSSDAAMALFFSEVLRTAGKGYKHLRGEAKAGPKAEANLDARTVDGSPEFARGAAEVERSDAAAIAPQAGGEAPPAGRSLDRTADAPSAAGDAGRPLEKPSFDQVMPPIKGAVRGPKEGEASQVFWAGKPLDVSRGGMTIGRGDLPQGAGTNDLVAKTVSAQHGTVRLREGDGQLTYTDHSRSGTYVRRAGSDRFERLPEGVETAINPDDVVRLGSEVGPELRLYSTPGEALPDGSIRYRRTEGDYTVKPDGTREFSDRAGIKRWEDESGLITRVRTANGGEVRYGYDSRGNLNRIEYPSGRVDETADGITWIRKEKGSPPTDLKGRMQVESDGSLRFSREGEPDQIRRLDGTTEVLHANGRTEYKGARLEIEKSRLSDTFRSHNIDGDRQARLDRLMEVMERSPERGALTEQEIAMTYHHINRLLNAGPDAPLPLSERISLAEQILLEAANPHSIDQGINKTCNVAVLENRAFVRHPADAARLVTDVATTGRYVTRDGTVVDMRLAPGALRPDPEARFTLQRSYDETNPIGDLKEDRLRTRAGQIFEMTAVNIKWARDTDFKIDPGDVIVYDKVPVAPGSKDSGERLFGYTVEPDGTLVRQPVYMGVGDAVREVRDPAIIMDEIEGIYNQIISGPDEKFVIMPGKSRSPDGMPIEGRVASGADLATEITRMQQYGELPAVLLVHTGNPPFSKSPGGWHVVNVHGIELDHLTGKQTVEFTNQWGLDNNRMRDRAISVDDLARAMQRPKSGEAGDLKVTDRGFGHTVGSPHTAEGPSRELLKDVAAMKSKFQWHADFADIPWHNQEFLVDAAAILKKTGGRADRPADLKAAFSEAEALQAVRKSNPELSFEEAFNVSRTRGKRLDSREVPGFAPELDPRRAFGPPLEVDPATGRPFDPVVSQWLENAKQRLGPDKARKLDQVLKEGTGRIAVLDRKSLQAEDGRLFSLEQGKERQSYRYEDGRLNLQHARDYNPAAEDQPLTIVRERAPDGDKYHVVNGCRRCYIFGSDSSNPDNLSIPVLIFDNPELYEEIFAAGIIDPANRSGGIANSTELNFAYNDSPMTRKRK